MNDIYERLTGQYPLRLGDRQDAAAEIARLRAELAELSRFRKVIMDYDSNLYDALADSDAARKGEGEAT